MKVRKGLKYLAAMIMAAGICLCAMVIMDGYHMYRDAEMCIRDSCINAGFTNVMFDGSSLPYEENVKRTAIVSALAHGMGCSVEGELGHVGQAADADDDNLDLYTDPDQAMDFVTKMCIRDRDRTEGYKR